MPDAGTASRPQATVIGEGQMGLVMADALLAAGCAVRVWGPFAEHVEELARTRVSSRLPMLRLDERIEVTADDAAALDGADLVVAAIPVQPLRSVFARLAAHVPGDAVLVSVAKGVENHSMRRPTEILAETTGAGPARLACLSGPTIATELAAHLPATMVAASTHAATAVRVQAAFSAPWLRVYTNDDLVGVELAGAIKNVIALAAGLIDGLELGSNAKSALLARGLAEIVRLGEAAGASRETFFGIAGVGDLATTCFSPEGRNRSCGEALGRGASLETYIAESACVVEGVPTTRSIVELARTLDVETPIIDVVFRILFEDLDPRRAIAELMTREAKHERVG